MKIILFVILVCFLSDLCSQNFYSEDWVYLKSDDIIHYTVNKTKKFRIKNLTIEIIWDEKMSKNKYLKDLGGIKSMKIYKDNQLTNTIQNIEDKIQLREINFHFYDFNFDGNLDFTIPINAGWRKDYLYNPTNNTFQNYEDWDYLKIQKINKKNKQILSQPDGNIPNSRELFQINGNEIIKIKNI